MEFAVIIVCIVIAIGFIGVVLNEEDSVYICFGILSAVVLAAIGYFIRSGSIFNW